MLSIPFQELANKTIEFDKIQYFWGLAIANPCLFILLGLVLADILTGIGASLMGPTLDSSIGLKGIIRHTILILLGVLMEFVFNIAGLSIVGNAYCIFTGFYYVESILGNLGVMGVKYPDWLMKTLEAEFIRKETKYSKGVKGNEENEN